MTKKGLMELDHEIVSLETLEEVEEMEEVVEVQDLGNSGKYWNKTWYVVKLTDGIEINLYN